MVRAITLGAVMLAAAPAAAQAQQWQYRCPAPGTVVERSEGGSLAYRGQDANDPLVCVTANGQRRFLGYWPADELPYRTGRAQLARLVSAAATGQTGQSAAFNYFAPGRDSNTVHVFETWRVGGIGRVSTMAGGFDAVRIDRNFQIAGVTYSFDQSVWFDRASGAPVKAEVRHLNMVMAPSLFSWEALDLRARPQLSAR